MPREICNTCLRPPSVCYCSALVYITNTIKVLIIQHPLEEKHPFNTGYMATLCLNNSELIITETLSESALDKIFKKKSALLYPSLEWLPKTEEINSSKFAASARIEQLVVIDANWRKSKKILHLHPRLQHLPRVNLTGNLQSNYTVRKTSIDNGLSTIESIIKASNMLEATDKFEPMLKPFERMIALQQQHHSV